MKKANYFVTSEQVGGDVAEAGNGPGSYDVVGNIWHLNCCNPESKTDALGWSIFSAIFGWSNNGSCKRPSLSIYRILIAPTFI
jgi:high-affinity Fe2+/Pb2+ permease